MTTRDRRRGVQAAASRDLPSDWGAVTVSPTGPAVALRAACRHAHALALDSLLDPTSTLEALVWVVCEMGWADQDLDDAGVPATRVTRSGAKGATSMTELLLMVVNVARTAVDTEVDERVRSTCNDAASRAEACLAVLSTEPESVYAQEIGGGGLDVRGALRSRPAS